MRIFSKAYETFPVGNILYLKFHVTAPHQATMRINAWMHCKNRGLTLFLGLS